MFVIESDKGFSVYQQTGVFKNGNIRKKILLRFADKDSAIEFAKTFNQKIFIREIVPFEIKEGLIVNVYEDSVII